MYVAGEGIIRYKFTVRKDIPQVIGIFQLILVAVVIFAFFAGVRVLRVVEAPSREFDVRVNNRSFHCSYNTNCVNGFKAELAQDMMPRFRL